MVRDECVLSASAAGRVLVIEAGDNTLESIDHQTHLGGTGSTASRAPWSPRSQFAMQPAPPMRAKVSELTEAPGAVQMIELAVMTTTTSSHHDISDERGGGEDVQEE